MGTFSFCGNQGTKEVQHSGKSFNIYNVSTFDVDLVAGFFYVFIISLIWGVETFSMA